MIQLDFFKTAEECEIESMRRQIASIKDSSDKVRRKLFAENGTLTRQVLELSERLEIIEKNLCKRS